MIPTRQLAEFLSQCADVYKSVMEELHTPRETVVVPTSDPSPTPEVGWCPCHVFSAERPECFTFLPCVSHLPSVVLFQVHRTIDEEPGSGEATIDGVDSMMYYRALIPVCEKLDLR